MERFEDYHGVSPEKFIAYLVRQASCTQQKLIEACKGVCVVALRSEQVDTPGALPGEPFTEGDLDREALQKLGVLQPLILLLSPKLAHGEPVRTEALICLNIMCKTCTIKALVVQMELLDRLKPILEDPPTDRLLYNLMQLIATLAAMDENQAIMAKRKFVPHVLKQVPHKDNEIRYEVARALANLGCHASNQTGIAKVDGIKSILGMTQAATEDTYIGLHID